MFYDPKQMEKVGEVFQKMAAGMPQVTVNKNGYELRANVLEFAQIQAWQDYHAKWGQFETNIKREGDELVTQVTMPDVPGTETVLEIANKFYEFVSNGGNTSSKKK